MFAGGRFFFIASTALVACSRRCCLIKYLADIWASRHSKEYSNLCCKMDSFSGPEMACDAENSKSHCLDGLGRPSPPNLVGNANMSLLVSLGGGCPVTIGIKTVHMMFSIC